MSTEITDEIIAVAVDEAKTSAKTTEDTVWLKTNKKSTEFEVVNQAASGSNNHLNAIAIAPLVDGKPDYSNTAIAYAGTNSTLTGIPLVPDVPISSDRGQSGFPSAAAAAAGALSGEYDPAVDFFYETQEIVASNGGKITVVGGHSQAGGYLMKFSAEFGSQYGFRTVSFDDWGRNQINTLTPSEQQWLRQHPGQLTRYQYDTWADISGRDHEFGTVISLTRDTHNGSQARFLRGNGLDLDALAAEGYFAAGMTEAQVREAAKNWIKSHPESQDLAGTPPKDLLLNKKIDEYLKRYGGYGNGRGTRASGAVSIDTALFMSGPALLNHAIEQLRLIQDRNNEIPERLSQIYTQALDESVAAFSALTTRYDVEAELHRRGATADNHVNVGEIERVNGEIAKEIDELTQLKATLTQVMSNRVARDAEDAHSFGF